MEITRSLKTRHIALILTLTGLLVFCRDKKKDDPSVAGITAAAQPPEVTQADQNQQAPTSQRIGNFREISYEVTEVFPDSCPNPETIGEITNSVSFPAPQAGRVLKTHGSSPVPLKKISGRVVAEVVLAQQASVIHENSTFAFYKVKHGLTQGTIRCLHEDRKGNLWLGTYGGGATRFDGRHFFHYDESQGLGNNVVFSIIEDKKGRMWFATNGGGLSVYDGGGFVTYKKEDGTGSNHIYALYEDSKGNIWIGTADAGLVKYDGTNFTTYTVEEGLAGNTVFRIFEDSQKRLWIGTLSGASCISNNKITNYGSEQGLSSETVLDIYEQSNGEIWFGTLKGVSVLKNGLIQPLQKKGRLSSSVIYHIKRDLKGDIWFGTSQGLARLRGTKLCFYREEQGLTSNVIHCIIEDHSGSLWIGSSSGGLMRTNFHGFKHYTKSDGLPSGIVLAIEQDQHNNLWFSSVDGGVSCFNGRSFRNYSFQQLKGGNLAHCILQDRKGTLWLGLDGSGLLAYKNGKFSQLTLHDDFASNTVYSLFEDRDGSLWIGTNGNGAFRFDGTNLTHFGIKQGLSHGVVYDITQDMKGDIWFGTYNGVSCYNGEKFSSYYKKDGLADDMVLCMVEDSSGYLWLGTNNGLSVLSQGRFLSFTEKDGLINKGIMSLVKDNQHQIWAGTRNGLSRIMFHPDQKPVFAAYNYNYDDGFVGLNCRRNSALADRQGNIWWGADVLTQLQPTQLKTDTTPPPISLTGIKLMGEKINWSAHISRNKNGAAMFVLRDTVLGNGAQITQVKYKGIKKWHLVPEDLSLPHNCAHISFGFTGLHLQDRNHLRYTYRLEGFDAGWSSETNKNEVSYNSLRPGHYTFMVRSMNRSGKWSDTLLYPFEVRPAWWQTWWFRALAVLVIAGLVRLYIYQRELHNRRAEEKLEKQNAELRKINSELDRFVYSASHELRAPLASLLGLLNLTSAEETSPSVLKKLNMMTIAVKRLDLFINDILNYSRNSRTEPETGKVDFEKLIHESMQSLSYLEGKDRIKVDVNITGEVFYSDSQRIAVLLNNLLSNAIKYQRRNENEPWIGITITVSPQKAVLKISDNGHGIAPGHLPKIFTMFYRANDHQPGSGLGLYISREIVTKMGGTLEVTSEVNKGSEFTITLPNHTSDSTLKPKA